MNKKLNVLVLVFCFLMYNIYAERLPPSEVKYLTKDNFTYKAAGKISSDEKYFFGIIVIESIDRPKYIFTVPIYAKKINIFLESDVQWIFIKSMEFKNDEIISIINENDEIYEFNINTYEVKSISGKSVSHLNELYADWVRKVIEENKKFKYAGAQPKRNKLSKIEALIDIVENTLFPIYTEEQIKKEMPYVISKYKNKWFLHGSLPDGWVGGVFEIIINSETSEIESLIHSE